MKIVLPVHHFPPQYSAGAELYTFRLARWLQDHGHTVEVVAIESITAGRPGELQEQADIYQGVPVRRLFFNLIESPTRRHDDYDNPLLERWFAAYFAQQQPDLAHFQAGYLLGVAPLRAAHAAGVPTVLTLHDYWYLCPRITLLRGDGTVCTQIPSPAGCAWCQRIEQRRFRLPDALSGGLAGRAAQTFALHEATAELASRRATLLPALALPDVVIAPSRFLASQFAEYVPAERMTVLRYGLDLAPFEERRAERRPGGLRIGYIGQVAPHKGVHLLVAAFRQLRTAQLIELHIHGGLQAQLRYVKAVQQQAAGDERITFHGAFANGTVASLLADLDAVVVPSTWYENSPLAISEAHAAGIPVITAALGGMAEMVADGVDGLHFRPGDANDLARALQRLIDEPTLLPRLRSGVRAPQSIDQEMQILLDLYQQSTNARAMVREEV